MSSSHTMRIHKQVLEENLAVSEVFLNQSCHTIASPGFLRPSFVAMKAGLSQSKYRLVPMVYLLIWCRGIGTCAGLEELGLVDEHGVGCENQMPLSRTENRKPLGALFLISAQTLARCPHHRKMSSVENASTESLSPEYLSPGPLAEESLDNELSSDS